MQLIITCLFRWFGFHVMSCFVEFFCMGLLIFLLLLFGVLLFYSKYCRGMNVMMKGELLIKSLLNSIC